MTGCRDILESCSNVTMTTILQEMNLLEVQSYHLLQNQSILYIVMFPELMHWEANELPDVVSYLMGKYEIGFDFLI